MLPLARFSTQLSFRAREISKRIQKALQELAENLHRERTQQQQQFVPKPQPALVPVPVRNRSGPFIRQFSTYSHASFAYQPSWSHTKVRTSWVNKYMFNNLRKPVKSNLLRLLNRGFVYHNFSQAYQNKFRLKLHQLNLRHTYRFLMTRLREKYQVYPIKSQNVERKNLHVRLNASNTPQNHRLILDLARTESSESKMAPQSMGSYIDYPIHFDLSIPEETILTGEIVDEMLHSIKSFEKKLQELKRDLTNLFDLGELPIKYLSKTNVLRIHFPNCDRERLEKLCIEKGIVGGVVLEEAAAAANNAKTKSPAQVYESDVLSSYGDESLNTCSSGVLSTESSDLVEHLEDQVVVRPWQELAPLQQVISVNEDYYFA